jgi:hypothetical protein
VEGLHTKISFTVARRCATCAQLADDCVRLARRLPRAIVATVHDVAIAPSTCGLLFRAEPLHEQNKLGAGVAERTKANSSAPCSV